MRIAALYDIHGNLPALEAVLAQVREAEIDQLVIGGDVVPGPMPCETLQRLQDLDLPVQFIQGNGELAMLALLAAPDEESVTYWGTTSGNPLPERYRPVYRWTAQQIQGHYASLIAGWPKTVRLEIGGLGKVLFCHGTPRSETETFTRLTADERLRPLFDGLGLSAVVCGHTHMQFDRQVGATRVVNAGSVGVPYGSSEAHWLVLGPDVQLHQTPYDLAEAERRISDTSYPQVREFIHDMRHRASEEEMLRVFSAWELK